MSRSYDLENEIQRSVADIVSGDFSEYGYDVEDIQGTLSISARLTIALPDGWEFASYNDSIEIERSLSI